MKIAYAFRRSTVYPFEAGDGWTLQPEPALTSFLQKVNEIGFDGLELGFEVFGGHEATKESVTELQSRLSGSGAPCGSLRAGGVLCTPIIGEKNRDRLFKSIEIAGWLGVKIVNSALSGGERNKTLGPNEPGRAIQPGSSQLASHQDYEITANTLKEAGIADNSEATLKLLEMTESPNVFANPDLGNILWHYDDPEESSEKAIVALAPHSRYWHCKNLQRVNVPEHDRSYFLRVPLPDGDIDYRFAINAMVDAGYDGYLALEGANTGDHISKDARSVQYVRQILAEITDGVAVNPT